MMIVIIMAIGINYNPHTFYKKFPFEPSEEGTTPITFIHVFVFPLPRFQMEFLLILVNVQNTSKTLFRYFVFSFRQCSELTLDSALRTTPGKTQGPSLVPRIKPRSAVHGQSCISLYYCTGILPFCPRITFFF